MYVGLESNKSPFVIATAPSCVDISILHSKNPFASYKGDLPKILQTTEAQFKILEFYHKQKQVFGEDQIKLVLTGENLLQKVNESSRMNTAVTDTKVAKDNIRAIMWIADINSILQGYASPAAMHCTRDEEAKFHGMLKHYGKVAGIVYRRLSAKCNPFHGAGPHIMLFASIPNIS